MIRTPDVAAVRCGSYQPQEIGPAMERLLSLLGGLDWVRPGMRIAVKTNLVAPKRPETLEADIPFVPTGTVSIQGQLTVTGLTANGGTIPCAGVFILRPAVAPTDLLPTLATANGAIQVDRSMATNLPGVFAAGDCTGAPYQIAKAAGEGQVAALSACAYLDDPAHQTT